MRFIVSLRIKDYEYEEIIIADNKIDAKRIAKINNPNSEIIRSDWTYKWKKFKKLILNVIKITIKIAFFIKEH